MTTYAATSRYKVSFEPVLKSSEVAALLGVTVATADRWAREGKLAAARNPGPHGHWRYAEADVRALRARLARGDRS